MNTKDLNFAYRVRHALNENLDHLPAATTDRLSAARKIALSRKKADSPLRVSVLHTAFASPGGSLQTPHSWLRRMSAILPLLIVALGLFILFQMETQDRINDTAGIDAAVLADELPLDAYLDHGFNAFLAKRIDKE